MNKLIRITIIYFVLSFISQALGGEADLKIEIIAPKEYAVDATIQPLDELPKSILQSLPNQSDIIWELSKKSKSYLSAINVTSKKESIQLGLDYLSFLPNTQLITIYAGEKGVALIQITGNNGGVSFNKDLCEELKKLY